jgi:hypothetical protein
MAKLIHDVFDKVFEMKCRIFIHSSTEKGQPREEDRHMWDCGRNPHSRTYPALFFESNFFNVLKYFIFLAMIMGLSACGILPQRARSFDFERLVNDVFAPQPGEKILVMIDLPHGEFSDHSEWVLRREMAEEWHEGLEQLATEMDFSVHPLFTYQATGQHSGSLPEEGKMGGQPVRLEEILADTDIVIALTEYSATAPLIEFVQRYPDLRAASMPTVTKAMEQTALAADYQEVARKCQILVERLDRALGAEVEFATGQRMYFDLRYRKAEVDDGQLHADKDGMRVINLPSGEAYIVPYEGEIEGQPSLTEGEIPVMCGNEVVSLTVEGNRIIEVLGSGECAAGFREYIFQDEARRNIAELGLGVNDTAVVTGNVLEDEKVPGMHWAFGLSEALGGTVGADDFSDPSHVVHQDIVYPKGGVIEVASLVLNYEDGTSEEIIKDGVYTTFGSRFPFTFDHFLVTWLLLTVGSMSYVAVDLERFTRATWGVKFAWIWITVVFGPLGMVTYLLSYQRSHRSSEPKVPMVNWRRALGATAYSVAGNALGMIFVQVVFNAVPSVVEASPGISLVVIYFLPLLSGWLIFRAPAMASSSKTRYRMALRRTLLAEIISTNLVLSGVFPLILIPSNLYPDFFGPISPPTYLLFSLAATVGGLLTFPYHAWMIRRGFHVWPNQSFIDGESAQEVDSEASPTLRSAWVVLVLSFILFIASLVLTIQLLT